MWDPISCSGMNRVPRPSFLDLSLAAVWVTRGTEHIDFPAQAIVEMVIVGVSAALHLWSPSVSLL